MYITVTIIFPDMHTPSEFLEVLVQKFQAPWHLVRFSTGMRPKGSGFGPAYLEAQGGFQEETRPCHVRHRILLKFQSSKRSFLDMDMTLNVRENPRFCQTKSCHIVLYLYN